MKLVFIWYILNQLDNSINHERLFILPMIQIVNTYPYLFNIKMNIVSNNEYFKNYYYIRFYFENQDYFLI